MTDVAELAAGTLFHPLPAAAPVAFAAAELARYLGRLYGHTPTLRGVAGMRDTVLELAPAGSRAPAPASPRIPTDAEYVVTPADGRIVFAATSPRALLAAAYATLEALGCRWSPSGAAGEHVPAPGAAPRALPASIGRPAFARRAWVSDLNTWHPTLPDRLATRLPSDTAFVDWMAKTGATGFLFIRHANDEQWVVPELLPELVRRGLDVEWGGHALPELLPRAIFDRHPEYFPVGYGGERTDLGNACTASRAALDTIHARARDARTTIPGAGDLHVWGLDVVGGGWCACAACRSLSPSDQALRVANAVAAGQPPDGRVYHLAYHDTIHVPATVRPDPRVWAEFAPRERCYAHALDNPTCAANRPYRDALAAHLDAFAGRVDVFEYYADAILFGGCAAPLVEVIARDLDYYRRAGVRGVSCLTFGTYSLLAHGINVEAFAQGAVDPERARTARDAYCTRAYGAAAAPLIGYFVALESLMAAVVTYGDVKLPPVRTDVRAALRRALDAVPAARRHLAAAGNGAAVAAQHALLDYTAATVAGLDEWVAARLDHAGDRAERALDTLAAALDHIRTLEPTIAGTWGTHDLEITHAFYDGALRTRS
jgi:hypothetical protein